MYRLKFDRFGHRKGTVVYDLAGSDYGTSSMDTFATQIPHKSVTIYENGDYPFFTVAEHDLEEV